LQHNCADCGRYRRQAERAIESDPVIKKGLQRRIINSRTLARYIPEPTASTRPWNTVLGIVRRYRSTVKTTMDHRQVFKDCEIATRNKVAEADAPRALEALLRMLGGEAMNTNQKRATSKIVLAN